VRSIHKIILHCSASDVPKQTAALIDQWHRARGFRKIGYHYFIRQDGTIERGRNEEEIGAHCEGENSSSIGICLAGLSNFSSSQFASLRTLLADLRSRYPHATVHGHREFPSAIKQGKTCPVYDVVPFKDFYEHPVDYKGGSVWDLIKSLLSLLKIFRR